jgi:Ca2+/Na+ antiporter
MRALYFLLAVTCFFALLLAFPVTVRVEYREKASACIRYLFLRFHIPPKKKKEKEEKPAEEKTPKKTG